MKARITALLIALFLLVWYTAATDYSSPSGAYGAVDADYTMRQGDVAPRPAEASLPSDTPTETPVRDLCIYLPIIIKNVPPPTPTPTATATARPGWLPITSQDFEGDFPGPWLVLDGNGRANGDFSWGRSTCRVYAGRYGAWAVGAGLQGRPLRCTDNYPNAAASWMIYGPFSLAGASAADLRFQLWLNSESGYDGLCRMASVDGREYHGLCDSGHSNGWLEREFDLAQAPIFGNLLGKQRVWVALIFLSDISITYPEGAFVDNITLRQCTAAACPTTKSAPGSGEMTEFTLTLTRPE